MDHCEKKKRKRNPRETANILSLLTFAYTGSLFKRGYKKGDLDEDDLYEVISRCNSKKCGDKVEKLWESYQERNIQPSIYRLMWSGYAKRYLLWGCVEVIWKIIKSIMEPDAVSNLVGYFNPGQTEITKFDAYYYASLVLIINIVESTFYHNYDLVLITIGFEAKTGFSSFLYRKALKLTPEAFSDISLGNLFTLLTKDVQAFVSFVFVLNDMWIGAIQSLLICYLIYAKVGAVSLIGIAVLLSSIPIELYLGRWIKKLTLETSRRTDERLQITQEVFSIIRIIKMFTWEDYFTNRINLARKKEMKKTLIIFYLMFVMIAIGILFSKIGFYVLLMAYIWMGYSSDTSLVFYIMSVFKEMRHFLGELVPISIGSTCEFSASLTRIEQVLHAKELPKRVERVDTDNDSSILQLNRATVRFGNEEILRNITLDVKPGLTVITGPLACGKSSLLKVFLRDYPLTEGELITAGRVSYASQDPWLFPSSIKQNILFGQTLDEGRYQDVLRMCALDFDLSVFEKGDETIVNDKGMNLSKGQQARINLARAIYKQSDIYLLDDSLSALDTHVKDFIYNGCIKSYLKGKVCILISQSASHIQNADYLVIMDRGGIQYFGEPHKDVLKEILVEDDDIDCVESRVNVANGKHFEMPVKSSKIKVYGEINKTGHVDYAVYPKYVIFGGGSLLLLFNLVLFVISQTGDSYTDQLLTKWVDEKQYVLNMVSNFTNIHNKSSTEELYQNSEFKDAESREKNTFNIFSIMMMSTVGLALVKTYVFFDFSRRASVNIHKAMIQNVVHAMTSFFDTNFIGNVLNRFSKDLVNIDERLPFSISNLISSIFSIVGIVTLIATVKPYFLIYVGIITVILVLTAMVYLPTGRSLKRLEASTRSPMIGHLNATFEGLTTIRAYEAECILRDEFDRHQDLYTSAHFTSIVGIRAFAFFMDMMCAVFQVAVVSRFIFVDTDTSAGNVGLALTQVFMLGGIIQNGVRSFAELENLMTSMERALEYTSIQMEPAEGTTHQNWPNQGSITYDNVSLTYNNNEVVLRNLEFRVESGQKIGIVGRTGAGKSSIISSIFRLYEAEGVISIDGVNIKSLALKFLRRNLAIIPQDPVLFSGSLRANLDPFREYEDEELWSVLEKVHIRDTVSDLNQEITSNCTALSLGQKQLICLARAILRKSKIVILDEASANMDQDTDGLLQETIRLNFKDCTVFNIAHRLQSVLGCDKVMVLERGEIEEYDTPESLLRNRHGRFYKMVKQAGLLEQFSDR
ncbi:unnamed protein product [Phaedon cochleariae]|uniref:Uncharacterized protein n=1 Tax=Phaedon cochleariae TaxID=80249 RepID=A0A9N9SJ08_PHACE|nr:unnamed protein product [Phaedon cochleariae]